ncbi:lipopolysaccharide biosynthesis protein [Klebsiella pneumoniae]|uniref:lipopolysaccharide biosynthesis protein n=1 Tax=Klebsiella pneumoniae TaxID=573 RepID=UPI001F2890AD|nr:lipopolysaccharide biosynthesis protein [Klebsiella pneumoniae]
MNKENAQRRPSVMTGAIWSVLDNMAGQAITFVIFIILAKMLTPDIYGMLSVSLLVTQFFKMTIFDSIATSIVRKSNPSNIDYNSAFFLCFVISIPSFTVVYFISPIIEQYMHIEGLTTVIRCTAVIIILSGASRIHEAWLSHNMLFKSLALRSILSITFGGCVGLYLAYQGYAVMSLVAQQIVTASISLVILWWKTPWKPEFKISKKSFKESFDFSKHVALSNFTNFSNQNSDVFFITYFLGPAAAGIYSAGKRIVNTLNLVLSSALMRVSLPAFSRFKDDIDVLSKKYIKMSYFTVVITAPAFIGLAVLAKDITILLLGDKWIASVEIMQIVSAVGFVTSIGYYNHSIMFARDRPDRQARLTMLYAISNIIVFFIFVRYGLIATALAFSIRTIALYPLSVWCACDLLNIKLRMYVKELALPVICALLMGGIMVWLNDNYFQIVGWGTLILKIIIGFVIYLSFTLLLSPKSKKQEVLNLFKSIGSRKGM